MFGYTAAPQAWWLTRGMARRAGVNLPRAVVEGWVTRRELALIVNRCVECSCDQSCQNWLAELSPPCGDAAGSDGATAAAAPLPNASNFAAEAGPRGAAATATLLPGFCPNRDVLLGLATGEPGL